MKNKSNKNIYYLLIILILIFITIIPIKKYILKERYNEYEIKQEEVIKQEEINYQEIIDKVKTQYQNNDVVGILEINNTDYIVPIMQSNDNDYYLNHTPDGEYNFMGSIYLDFRVDIDNDKKLLIYGHNSSNIDMPFKILENYYDKDYYNNHKYIEITTSKEKKKYEIFSVHVETSDFSYMNTDFSNEEEYLKHITNLKNRSMYDINIDLTEKDEILILQTCSTHKDYKKYNKKYLLIVLKRI